MANTHGGRIYLGVEDNGTPTGVNRQHRDLVEMSARIYEHTSPAICVDLTIEQWDGIDILVIAVPRINGLVMSSNGKYLKRRLKQDGTPETITIKPHEMVSHLSHVRAMDPSAQIIETIPARDALSAVERERLRSLIQTYHGDQYLLDLSDNDLDKALGLVEDVDGELFPTVAGLLLIGHEHYIRKFIPGHEVIFQVLDGLNVLVNDTNVKTSLLSVFEKIGILFQAQVVENEMQVGLFRVPIPNYEKEAFREGFVNALVHRDYFQQGAVHVQLHKNLLCISSPGGFLDGISPQNILTTMPTPRNARLADAVKRIGLAERTGRGIDKIYSAMLRSGHGLPDYSNTTNNSVVLRLVSSTLDEAFIQIILNEERRSQKSLPLDSLIVLSVLKTDRNATIDEFVDKIQKPSQEIKPTLESLIEIGLIERWKKGKEQRYILSSKVYASTNNEEGYVRQRGLSTQQEKELILEYCAKEKSITRSKTSEICKCTANHASWLVSNLLKEGKILRQGNGPATYYTLNN